jgi:hypothetical protein
MPTTSAVPEFPSSGTSEAAYKPVALGASGTICAPVGVLESSGPSDASDVTDIAGAPDSICMPEAVCAPALDSSGAPDSGSSPDVGHITEGVSVCSLSKPSTPVPALSSPSKYLAEQSISANTSASGGLTSGDTVIAPAVSDVAANPAGVTSETNTTSKGEPSSTDTAAIGASDVNPASCLSPSSIVSSPGTNPDASSVANSKLAFGGLAANKSAPQDPTSINFLASSDQSSKTCQEETIFRFSAAGHGMPAAVAPRRIAVPHQRSSAAKTFAANTPAAKSSAANISAAKTSAANSSLTTVGFSFSQAASGTEPSMPPPIPSVFNFFGSKEPAPGPGTSDTKLTFKRPSPKKIRTDFVEQVSDAKSTTKEPASDSERF